MVVSDKILSGGAFTCERELIAAEEGDSVFICKSMVGPSASGKHTFILVLDGGESSLFTSETHSALSLRLLQNNT